MKSERVHDNSRKKSQDGRNGRRRETRRDSRDGQNSRNTNRNYQSNRDRIRSERDYKYDRRERKVSNNDVHRGLKTDYQVERRRMRSISRERKRSLSRERTSWLDRKRSLSRDRMSWLVCKRRSLSREKHTDSVKDYGRHSPRDRQYKDSLIKYRSAKDEFRSSSISKDRVRKSLPLAREEDLSPISDIERLSTPTLSSYGSPLSPERGRRQSHQRVRRYRRSRSRSRSRSFVSYTSLSSESRYERPRRKRSPFLREIQRKLSEHDKQNAIKKLSNFSFAASFQSFSNQVRDFHVLYE